MTPTIAGSSSATRIFSVSLTAGLVTGPACGPEGGRSVATDARLGCGSGSRSTRRLPACDPVVGHLALGGPQRDRTVADGGM